MPTSRTVRILPVALSLSRGGCGDIVKNPVDIHIGQRVRPRRWLSGLTQQQLAEALGIRFQQIQKYESGANRISASRLWEIARAMNVQVSFFFTGLGGADDTVADGDGEDRMQAKETFELVRAYYELDQGPRRQLLALAQALGDKTEGAKPSDGH